MPGDPETPAGTLRAQQKARTRALILEAARARFLEQGYERTTVREIAAAAGVALGTIFKHFPDKSSLLIAATLDDLNGIEQEGLGDLDLAAPLDEQLRVFITAVYRFWEPRQALARVLLRETWFGTGPWAEEYRDETARLMDRATELVASYQQRGELRADADPRVIARSVYATYLFRMMQTVDTPAYDPEALGREMQQHLQQLLRGAGP